MNGNDPQNFPGVSGGLLAHALANISDGSLITDSAQNILYANAAFCQMSGYAEYEVLGRNCRFLQGETSDVTTIANIRRALSVGETFRGNILNRTKDGRAFWNSLTITAIKNERGAITHYVSVQRDVTDLIALQDRALSLLEREREQRETTQSLLRVTRVVNDLSTVVDVSQAISDAANELCATNRSAVVLWDDTSRSLATAAQSGWTGDLAGTVLAFEVPGTDLPGIDEFALSGEPVFVTDGDDEALNMVLRRNDLAAFWYMPVAARGKFFGIVLVGWSTGTQPARPHSSLTERLTGLAGIATVALENARLLSEARWHARHDALTGLPNRTVLETALDESLRSVGATSGQVAVLYCDIDRFKLTNDGLGHAAGDAMLVEVAAILQNSVRSRDVVARVGGDEFVIVLPFVTKISDAHDVVDRIRAALMKPLDLEGSKVLVAMSIGIAISDPRRAPTAPITRAQVLIRAADADMYREKARKSGKSGIPLNADGLRLDTDLRGAVDRGEIEAFYQPQVDLATDKVVAVEGGFADQVKRALDTHRIPADALTVEVTESRLIADVVDAAHELSKIRDLGAGVSIDDVGTGQASISQLFDLPVTELKIDRSFVQNHTKEGEAFISAMVGLSQDLDLRVVAEGVSTDQDLEFVRDLGCDRAQGFGIAIPMAEQDLDQWRTTRAADADESRAST